MIRKGFPSKALDSFGANIGATDAELAEMLGISARALAWRRRKGILTPYDSERMFRVARVVARAEEVFGDLAKGLEWLKSLNPSLGGVSPMSLLDTYIGGDWVMDKRRLEMSVVYRVDQPLIRHFPLPFGSPLDGCLN